jgi:hypothetical protein
MMQKLWIKLGLSAALAAGMAGMVSVARAADDTARFYGQWKITIPVNGQMITIISVHDANGTATYVQTGNGFTLAGTAAFSAANGIWFAVAPPPNNAGTYRFINKDKAVCTNAIGQTVTWTRDSTPLTQTAVPASPPAVLTPSPSQTTPPESRAVVQSKRQRGSAVIADVQSDLAPGNYYALVIGINTYVAPLPTLKTAVSDARSVADVLSGQYGFQVTTLLDQDATRDNIFKAITHFRKSLAENDSFLIYYAGHGSFDRETAKAYWLPADADPDPLATSRDISADDLTTEVRGLAARHVIIISDSCFAGDISRDAGDFSPSDGNAAYIHRMQGSPSRTLMASGSDEPVSDSGSRGHSVFADQLLQAMQSPSEKSFTADDLFVSIRKSVLNRSGQSPQYTSLRDSIRSSSNLDSGDFVFNRKAAVGRPRAVPAK